MEHIGAIGRSTGTTSVIKMFAITSAVPAFFEHADKDWGRCWEKIT